jgi:hypothetical protein
MKQGFLLGLIAAAAAFAIGFAGPATAQSGELPECNEATLWTVAETSVSDPLGTLWQQYQCMPEGWQLIGETYCSVDGNCSSN